MWSFRDTPQAEGAKPCFPQRALEEEERWAWGLIGEWQAGQTAPQSPKWPSLGPRPSLEPADPSRPHTYSIPQSSQCTSRFHKRPGPSALHSAISHRPSVCREGSTWPQQEAQVPPGSSLHQPCFTLTFQTPSQHSRSASRVKSWAVIALPSGAIAEQLTWPRVLMKKYKHCLPREVTIQYQRPQGSRGAPSQATLGGHHGLNVVIMNQGKPRLLWAFASLASGQVFVFKERNSSCVIGFTHSFQRALCCSSDEDLYPKDLCPPCPWHSWLTHKPILSTLAPRRHREVSLGY